MFLHRMTVCPYLIRDISYGSYIAGDHFDEPPPPTYSTSYHQLHPGVVVSTGGDPGLSQDDPYGVGASHPPQQQSPSPPLSDRAYGKLAVFLRVVKSCGELPLKAYGCLLVKQLWVGLVGIGFGGFAYEP